MITAVSLNPSIDRTLALSAFHYGETNRVRASKDVAGGKALNVCLALRALGNEAQICGLMPEGGELFTKTIQDAGARSRFVSVPGKMRVNLKILDESNGTVTELNERGAEVCPPDLDALAQFVRQLSAESQYLVLTGSLPPGCHAAYYKTLALSARESCHVALDASGEPLRLALEARPFLVKPNRAELEGLIGSSLPTLDAVKSAARSLIQSGVGIACVTLGSEGALITDGSETLFAPALSLPVQTTVGAGDSMVAGLLAALSHGGDLKQAFLAGLSTAAARIVHVGTGFLRVEDHQQMMDKIAIQRL